MFHEISQGIHYIQGDMLKLQLFYVYFFYIIVDLSVLQTVIPDKSKVSLKSQYDCHTFSNSFSSHNLQQNSIWVFISQKYWS